MSQRESGQGGPKEGANCQEEVKLTSENFCSKFMLLGCERAFLHDGKSTLPHRSLKRLGAWCRPCWGMHRAQHIVYLTTDLRSPQGMSGLLMSNPPAPRWTSIHLGFPAGRYGRLGWATSVVSTCPVYHRRMLTTSLASSF